MKFSERIQHVAEAFTGKSPKAENSLQRDAQSFLRTGNRQPLIQDWSQVEITDQDMYTGYSYAAITKRANKTAWLAKNFLDTSASNATTKEFKDKKEELIHPYIELIRESIQFSQKQFWYQMSTYLDLEGIYYLMAVRAVSNVKQSNGTAKVGEIQYFSLLNPYNIKRVVNEKTGELGGYVEYKGGTYREIPKELIIEIRLLNPFDNGSPYSMTDAAKESQFTLKQAGDYTRHSIQGNINAPGAITTDVQLDDNIFANFVSRVRNHSKGEPLYGNGAGAIKWESMQIDLDKAALDTVNEIHRSTLFAVSGTSKTAMGIEESGTTRDVSKTQNDNFTSDAIIPRTEDIIDALNLDYRTYYNTEWSENKFEIIIDNPLESDRDSEIKDVEIRQSEYDLAQELVQGGYKYEIAAKYAHGDMTLEELGEPTETDDASSGDGSEDGTTDTSEVDATMADLESQLDNNTVVGKVDNFNKLHDKTGRFGEGDGDGDGSHHDGTDGAVSVATKGNAQIAKATSGSKVGKIVEVLRQATGAYLKANGGNVDTFKSIEENWVGNDYKAFEDHVKNGDSKELSLMHDLQMQYFKKNNIKEVTVYRGVYNEQAKAIKEAIKSGKPVKIAGDYASSFTGYKQTAEGYADGGSFTAPNKITDSVVIKKTFKPEDIVYSTQVSAFYAGNGDDEFIVSTPKGYSVDASDVEILQ